MFERARDSSSSFARGQRLVTALAEPFISGFDPAVLEATLAEVGFELIEDVTDAQLVDRYDPDARNRLHGGVNLHTTRARKR